MPSLTVDHTISIANTVEIVTLPLDYHIVKAATVQCLLTAGFNNEAWVQLAILAGDNTKENIVAILKSGYSGILTPVYWTGSAPVEADSYLAALITGRAGDTYRLSTLLWKIRLDEKGEFRADP